MADDLAGACDAGVQFAKCGFNARVWIDFPKPELFPQADLTIITTNSRNDPPVVAQRKVAQGIRLAFEAHSEFVYKKIDSTLRGNIGPEISVATEDGPHELVMVAPAYPAMGRIVEEGWLKVVKPFPKTSVNLPVLLGEQGLKHSAHLSRSALTGGRCGLINSIQCMLRSNANRPLVLSLDSIQQSDLTLIAEAASEIRPRPLMVGSAGLAAEVARVLAEECGKKAWATGNASSADTEAGSVIAIVGSTNPVTTAQIEYISTRCGATVLRLGRNDLNLRRDLLERASCVVVTTDMAEQDTRSLAALVELLGKWPIRGVLFSGGETANLGCRALGAAGIELRGEIAPGIPWGHFVGGLLAGTAVATKAGGFGDLNAFEVVSDFFLNPKKVSR